MEGSILPPPPPPQFGISIIFAFSCKNCNRQEKQKKRNNYAKFGGKLEVWQCGSDEGYPHCEVAHETGSKLVPQNKPTVQFDIKAPKSHALLKMTNFSAPYVSSNAKIVELLFPYSIETRF